VTNRYRAGEHAPPDRVNFALFMAETLENDELVHEVPVGRSSTSRRD